MATSFFEAERDAPIASVLVRTLLETEQEVPDFLESYKPEGDDLLNLKWETNSNPEDRPKDAGGDFGDGGFGGGDDAKGGDGGWGQGDDGGNDAGASDGNGWGAENQASAAAGGGDGW